LEIAAQSVDLASMVKLQLEPLANTSHSAAPPTYDESIELRDQIEDVEEVAIKLQPLTVAEMYQLEKLTSRSMNSFVIETRAWSRLRHDMRQFVFPTVKQYIQANVEGVWTEGVDIDRVACRVQWEFHQFQEQELDHDDDISSVLTISGRVNNAEASSCGDYMRQTWPDTGDKLLEAFLELSKHNSRGKYLIPLDLKD
jgi:hypothetical protein